MTCLARPRPLSMTPLNCAILAPETPVAALAAGVSVLAAGLATGLAAAAAVRGGAVGVGVAAAFLRASASTCAARWLAACRLEAKTCDLARASRAAFSD